MAKYLVTGGAGFIGSHLCDALLASGDEVIIIDNLSNGKRENIPPKATFIEGDVLDVDLVNSVIAKVDGCFHLAAIVSVIESKLHWRQTHEVNMVGTINILNAIAQYHKSIPIPVFIASSCAVYGDNSQLPLTELSSVKPISAYAADKLGSETHAYVAHHLYQIPVVCFRIFNAYGPRQDPKSTYAGVIPLFLEKIKKNDPITVYGDGKQTRDFVYIKDIVAYFMQAKQERITGFHVLNLCTGVSSTINELIKLIGGIVQNEPNISHEKAREGDVYHSLGSDELSRQLLNYKAHYSLEAGLLEWYQSYC